MDHSKSDYQKNLISIGQAGFKQKPSKPIHTSKSGSGRLDTAGTGAFSFEHVICVRMKR